MLLLAVETNILLFWGEDNMNTDCVKDYLNADDIIYVYRNYYGKNDAVNNIKNPYEKNVINDYLSTLDPCFNYLNHIVSCLKKQEDKNERNFPRETDAIESSLSEEEKRIWEKEGIKDLDIQNRVIKNYIENNDLYFLRNFGYAFLLLNAPKRQINKVRTFLEKLTSGKAIIKTMENDIKQMRIEQVTEKEFNINESFKPTSKPLENAYHITLEKDFVSKAIWDNMSEEEKACMTNNKIEAEQTDLFLDASHDFILIWFKVPFSELEDTHFRQLILSCTHQVYALSSFVRVLFGENGLFFKERICSFDEWQVLDPDFIRLRNLKEVIRTKLLAHNLFFLDFEHLDFEHRASAYNNDYYAPSVDNQTLHLSYDESAFNNLRFFKLAFDSSSGLLIDLPIFYEDITPDDVFNPIVFDFIYNYYYRKIIFIQCQRFAKGNLLSTYLNKERRTKREIKKGLREFIPFMKAVASDNINYEIAKPEKPSFDTIFLQSINSKDECSSLFKSFKELRTYVETEQEKIITGVITAITFLTLVSVIVDSSNFAYSYFTISSPNTYKIAFIVGLVLFSGLILWRLIHSIINRR